MLVCLLVRGILTTAGCCTLYLTHEGLRLPSHDFIVFLTPQASCKQVTPNHVQLETVPAAAKLEEEMS